MTDPEFRRSVRETQPLLQGLGLHRGGWVLRGVSEEFKRLSLGGDGYPEVYKVGLQNRDWTFLLDDLSYFHLQRLETRGGGFTLRYSFLPNPFRYHSFEAFREEFDISGSDLGAIELYHQYLDEQPAEIGAPSLRYEVDYEAYAPLRHPCCHLHVGHNTGSRWPVERVMSPKAFVLFVTKWFYSEVWFRSGDEHDDPTYFERVLERAKAESVPLAVEHFCEDERAQPFLS